MLATPVVMFLLASAASGNQVLEEATSSCGAAAAMESTRCLIQQQKATLQTAKLHKAEEKSKWTGALVDLEFAKTAEDMDGLSTFSFIDYDTVDPNVTGNVTKTGMQIKFTQHEGGQVVSDDGNDMVDIYGFTAGTSGLVNSNKDRLWVGNPVTGESGEKGQAPTLIYGIAMKNVPGNGEYKYHIEFAKTPPTAIKLVPSDGKVKQMGHVAAVGLICDDPDACSDGDILVSAVQFTPTSDADKDAMMPDDTHLFAQKEVPVSVARVLESILSDESLEADDAEKEEAEEKALSRAAETAAPHMKSLEADDAEKALSRAAEMDKSKTVAETDKSDLAQMQHQEAKEEKSKWTGSIVDVEFASTAIDMAGAVPFGFIDYSTVDPKVNGNVTKTAIQIKFPHTEGGQIVSDSDKDVIDVYGFTPGTSGMVNSNANRIWVGNPVTSVKEKGEGVTADKEKGKGPKLFYGVTMKNVPGKSEWNYHVEFAKTPPAALKIMPKNGKVAQIGNMAAVGLMCDDPDECGDGDVVVSAVQFRPITSADKTAMKNTHLLAQEELPSDPDPAVVLAELMAEAMDEEE